MPYEIITVFQQENTISLSATVTTDYVVVQNDIVNIILDLPTFPVTFNSVIFFENGASQVGVPIAQVDSAGTYFFLSKPVPAPANRIRVFLSNGGAVSGGIFRVTINVMRKL